jgi:fatty acid desaturase
VKTLTTITDPIFIKPEKYSALNRLFLKLLSDERDLPFIYLSLQITATLLPLGIALFFVRGWLFWIFALAYLYLNNFYFKGPFGLMLHCTCHRVFFKREYGFLNHYLPWVLGPLFGQTPETYYTHHIGMHHPENNMPDDDSCTMFYQRDSLKEFGRYFVSFFFVGIVNLSNYFIKKKRRRLMYRSIRGELLYFMLCVALCFVNWPATLVVFILPFIISRVVMMMGNWTQHAFIDANDPDNAYRNSITCINTKYNEKCWNDGYHISHHIKPSMHWTEHPVYFQESIDEYAANDAIVFDDLHFLQVFIYLVQKRYDVLAKHFVNINGRFQSDEEVAAFLKSRTEKIPEQMYLQPA